jgi:ribonuclease P protein component
LLSETRRQTLSRHRRIGRQEGFKLESGNDVSSNNWFVVYVRKNNAGLSRLGIIVSKKIAPAAVSRNFAKRLVREAFRCTFPAGCALDVIVRVRRRFGKEAAKEVSGALIQLLSGVQLKCGY